MSELGAILAERGATYGDFTTHAEISQAIKAVMAAAPGWARMLPHERETCEMIAHKLARLLNGNPHHEDSWRDIAGYATLSADRNLPPPLLAAKNDDEEDGA